MTTEVNFYVQQNTKDTTFLKLKMLKGSSERNTSPRKNIVLAQTRPTSLPLNSTSEINVPGKIITKHHIITT